MKKTLTLFLLFVFLLNVLGFYGVFLGMKFKNALQLTIAFDEDRYSSEDLITFKVPLTVPYYTDPNAEFKRVDGEFENNGQVYRMVKQKLQQDTLYVVCINDKESKDMNDFIADCVKSFTDKPSDGKHQTVKSFSFLKDYVSTSITVESDQSGWNKTITFIDSNNIYRFQTARDIFSPPKAILIG